MIYKLFNEPTHSPIDQILINRGLAEEQLEEGKNAGGPQINSPGAFGREKVEHAIKLMSKGIYEDNDFYVVVDCDCDGYSSSAIIMNYLYKVYPERIDCFHYIHHTGKQHGLKDVIDQIPDNCLVILPDSSTNDVEEIKILLKNNCAVVVLD